MTESWVKTTLGEAAEVLMGQSPPGDSYNTQGDGLPFLQGSAEFGVDAPSPVKWCSQPVKVAEVGDLMVSVRAPVGDTNFADQRIAIGRGLAIVRARPGALTRYLRLVIQNETAALLAASGSGMFSSITASNLRAFAISLPPLAVQRRIVDLMAHVDNQLARLQAEADAVESTLVALRDTFFASLVDRQALGHVLLTVRAGGTPSREHPEYFNGDVPWLKSGEVNNANISATEESITQVGLAKSSAWLVPAGSVVVAMYGQGDTKGTAGYLATSMATNQAVLALVPNEDLCSGRFLLHWFRWHTERLRAAATGAAQPNLSKGLVEREVTFPVLSRSAQIDIAKTLDCTMQVAESLLLEAKRLKDVRSALLQALLLGDAAASLSDAYDLRLAAAV